MKEVVITVMNIAGSIVMSEYHFFLRALTMNTVAVQRTTVASV